MTNMDLRLSISSVWLSLVMPLALSLAALNVRAAEPDFARDVRPILSQYCFKCHGPDKKTRAGGLRLDERASALVGGDSLAPAIVPGKASDSELIKRITSKDPDMVMPPPSTKRALAGDQIDTLKRWIDAQAAYAEHWAFQPVTNTPFEIAQPTGTGPIDSLVAKLARERNLDLAEPADRGTWLRRVYLDVIGLPPNYDEVLQYANDLRVDAKERVVDRLLASPAFGETLGAALVGPGSLCRYQRLRKGSPRALFGLIAIG